MSDCSDEYDPYDDYDDDYDGLDPDFEVGQVWRSDVNPAITCEIVSVRKIDGKLPIIISDNRTREKLSSLTEHEIRTKYHLSTRSWLEPDLRPPSVWINVYRSALGTTIHPTSYEADRAPTAGNRVARLHYTLNPLQSFHCVDGKLAERLAT